VITARVSELQNPNRLVVDTHRDKANKIIFARNFVRSGGANDTALVVFDRQAIYGKVWIIESGKPKVDFGADGKDLFIAGGFVGKARIVFAHKVDKGNDQGGDKDKSDIEMTSSTRVKALFSFLRLNAINKNNP